MLRQPHLQQIDQEARCVGVWEARGGQGDRAVMALQQQLRLEKATVQMLRQPLLRHVYQGPRCVGVWESREGDQVGKAQVLEQQLLALLQRVSS